MYRLRRHAPAERVYEPFADAYLTDYEGSLWIGTFGGGAARLRATHLRQLTATAAVRLARDANGTVWATGQGLWRVPRGAEAAEHVPLGQVLRAIAPVRGGLLVSANAAAYRITPAERARGRVGPALAYYASWISALDAATDTLYVATYGEGVARIVGGRPLDTLRAGHGLPTDLSKNSSAPVPGCGSSRARTGRCGYAPGAPRRTRPRRACPRPPCSRSAKRPTAPSTSAPTGAWGGSAPAPAALRPSARRCCAGSA